MYTARYAGEGCSYADNRTKMLQELDGVADRGAAFKTVAMVVWPDGTELAVEGVCPGTISVEERGSMGSATTRSSSPPKGDGRTFAEMGAEAKNELSHRGRAFRGLLNELARR